MIKNKDGTSYTLSKPNKLAATQLRWDLERMIFHNWHWEEIFQEKLEDIAEIIESEREKEDFQAETIAIIDEMPEPKPEPIIAIDKKESEPEPKIQEELPELKNVILFHCLPARVKQTYDDLYGENIEKVEYGKKFIFPGIILANVDLMMRFWTSDPHSQIGKQSIVFPYRYKDGPKLKEFRWWRITQKIPKEVGFIFEGIPSSFQPDFSD